MSGAENPVPEAKYLFEVSFEVANKVGGIYAVIKSKIPEMLKYYGENYYLIGYYDAEKAKYEFSEEDAGVLKPAFANLEKQKVKCKFGRWHTEGMPKCILIDIINLRPETNQIKTDLWFDYQIDSLRADSWFGDPVVWSKAAGMVVEELVKTCGMRKGVAHFHEWLAGGGILYLKKKKVPVGTVFTTHATVLGRTMASFDDKAQDEITSGAAAGKTVDPKKAYQYNVEAKHLMEKACAANAGAFTAVSNATSKEAEYILGKKTDVVLPNGLEIDKFPAMEELSYLHTKYKTKILEFLRGYFGAYYDPNLDDPRILYLSGRYEFRNKGIDVFVKGLGRLNSELKKNGYEKDIFAFIFVPSDVSSENLDVLENVSLYRSIEEYVHEIAPDICGRIVANLGGVTAEEKACVLSDGERSELKRLYLDFRSKAGKEVPMCAFKLNYDENNDMVLKALKSADLRNRKEDRVKVIFYPQYLSNSDRLLAMSYKAMSIGCSAGIFPSFYEPWGYTPLEAAAYGSISLTTDYAGYGQFLEDSNHLPEDTGVFVLKRRGKKDDDIVADLTTALRKIVLADKNEIIRRKHNAKITAGLADWRMLAKNYIYAHNIAIRKATTQK